MKRRIYVVALLVVGVGVDLSASTIDEKEQNKDYSVNIAAPDVENGQSVSYVSTNGNTYAVDVESGSIRLLHPQAAAVASVAAPTFSPNGGNYSSPQLVTLKSSTVGAQIYYTLDGTTPTIASLFYHGALSINSNSTVKAFAVKNGSPVSGITSATFQVPSLTWPGASISLGTYSLSNYFPPHVLNDDIPVPQAVDTHWLQMPSYYLLAVAGPDGRNFTGSCSVVRPDGYKVALICNHNLGVGRNLVTLKAIDATSSVVGIFYLDITK